jgi:bifunctional enzyme CysN/CysC
MVTGASNADLAIILVDARKGVVEQSRRHAFIASLLRVPHMVLAVNKMDLVDWDEAVFDLIVREFSAFAAKLDITDLTAIPISALHGDNVVERSTNMGWYAGPSLLYHLEHLHIASDRNLIDCRFPVQGVIRPTDTALPNTCRYAGQVASGIFRVGDEVAVLPSGRTTRIARIECLGEAVDEALPPQSVTIQLEDRVDASRGDCICRPGNRPAQAHEIEAMLCWMSDRPMAPSGRYAIKHTTRSTQAEVEKVHYRVDVNTLHRDPAATSLQLNDVGRVRLRVNQPLLVDDYRRNRTTGSFILIDEVSNETVAGGMVLEGA